MFLQWLRKFALLNKYYFLLFAVVSLFFWPVFRGQIPFPGDLLVNYYEPYKAYPILNYPVGAAVSTKNQGADVLRHMFPWKSFAVESFKKGEIPFWNPHNFSGNPLMANFQSAVFYPPNIVFFFLPYLNSWTIYVMLAPLLSSIFMFLYLREIKLSSFASVFGGITFAFSSYMVVWIEYGNIGHTFLWIPLGLLFTEKIIKGESLKNYIYLIFTLLMSILAGYIQGYFYVVAVISIYFLAKNFLNKSLSFKKILFFFVTLIFPVLLSLFQVLPTKLLFEESTRTNYTWNQIGRLLNPWWYSITAIVPNFFGNPASSNHWFYGTYIERVSYIGIIPFTLFVYALLNFRKRKETLIFGALAVLSFLLCLDLLITRYFFQIPIPTISTTVPTRMLSIFEFCAIALAAIGLETLRERKYVKKLIVSFAFIFSLLLACWIFVLFIGAMININLDSIAVTRRNLILPTSLSLSFAFLSLLWFRKVKFALLLVFFLTLFDLFYFFDKITPFSPKEFVYPQTPVISYLKNNAGQNRFWGYGGGYIESNFQTFDETFSPEGVDPLHIKRYGRLLASSSKGEILEELPRADANLAPGYGPADLRKNRFRQRLLNLLGVKYILHKNEDAAADFITFPDEVYRLIYHDGYYQIYENKEALPRVLLVPSYIIETDKQKIANKLFDTSFDLKKTLVLEEKINPPVELGSDENSTATIKKYGNNEVLISTTSKTNMFLFLSDTHMPLWKAKVDGVATEIYRADYAFRAVVAPKGKHVVSFYYSSKPFYDGLKYSMLSLIVLIVSFVFLNKYEKKK